MALPQYTHNGTSQIPQSKKTSLSIVSGPKTPELWKMKLGDLIDQQASKNGDRTAAVFSWQDQSFSYAQLADRSKLLAKAMLESGLKHGDCVGIMAGNCYQYIEIFLGAARIGCPFVVLNNTYTAKELCAALSISACKLLFIPSNIGHKSLSRHIEAVCTVPNVLPDLKRVVMLSPTPTNLVPAREILPYSVFSNNGHSIFVNNATLRRAERRVKSSDVLNLQFTSGTTGAPKAAMLTHFNLINNGKFFGDGLSLTSEDIVCCPPPLFHCFGLVMGFLSAFTHSANIIFPCDQFEPNQVLDALAKERCTVLLGVPTMFLAEIEANKRKGYKFDSLKTGLASGSPVASPLVKNIQQKLGIQKVLIAYGMTETSPVTFMIPFEDSDEVRFKTVGRVMPHTMAKVVDPQGNILPRGVPGEMCTSGYALQKGYWKNDQKTAEVMRTDDDGVRWMHTGDECVITEDGYCLVTGRIKDLIIRGGENISPVEIEERLMEHSSITEASVVGVKDDKYGEVVGCFLRSAQGARKLELQEIDQWVRERLGGHKVPKHVFWIGEPGIGSDFPKTGSGKHQKHILRALAEKLVGRIEPKAKL